MAQGGKSLRCITTLQARYQLKVLQSDDEYSNKQEGEQLVSTVRAAINLKCRYHLISAKIETARSLAPDIRK